MKILQRIPQNGSALTRLSLKERRRVGGIIADQPGRLGLQIAMLNQDRVLGVTKRNGPLQRAFGREAVDIDQGEQLGNIHIPNHDTQILIRTV